MQHVEMCLGTSAKVTSCPLRRAGLLLLSLSVNASAAVIVLMLPTLPAVCSQEPVEEMKLEEK